MGGKICNFSVFLCLLVVFQVSSNSWEGEGRHSGGGGGGGGEGEGEVVGFVIFLFPLQSQLAARFFFSK